MIHVSRFAYRRKLVLNVGLSSDLKTRIKLSEKDLKCVRKHTALFLRQFVPERLYPQHTKSEVEFWMEKELEENDWKGDIL